MKKIALFSVLGVLLLGLGAFLYLSQVRWTCENAVKNQEKLSGVANMGRGWGHGPDIEVFDTQENIRLCQEGSSSLMTRRCLVEAASWKEILVCGGGVRVTGTRP